MSRTDNTDPYWVRATWWKPFHQRCQHSWLKHYECDLPAEPVPASDSPAAWRVRGTGRCRWTPSYEDANRAERLGRRNSARDFIRVVFTKPERARVRRQLERARGEYHAFGEVETICTTDQHRHQGLWAWW